MISYGRQTLDNDDIDAVVAVLQSDCITQGSLVTEFENLVSDYCNVSSAVAVTNGTMGLVLCCRAMGLTTGGLLWTSPNSYVASANCAHFCGAEVDFVDIDYTTGNMDVCLLEEKLIRAERAGRLPDIVIPVHFGGHSCPMESIARLARRFGFRVIEDACHALGGSYSGEKVGSCRWSDASVFSFHPVKSITTGEGGMVVSNNGSLISKIRVLGSGGVCRHARLLPWYCEMEEPGINGRLSEVHAALGISQINKLDNFIEARREIASHYLNELASTPLMLPPVVENSRSAWHLFVVHVDDNRNGLCESLRRAGIGVNVHYVPIHTHPWFLARGFSRGDFPNAERHFDTAITLPIYPTIGATQLDYIISTVSSMTRQAA